MKFIKTIVIASIFLFSSIGIAQNPHAESGLKKVIVQEVLQVDSYTYLNVLENGTKKWLAVPRMEANLGEVYYYKGGMTMPDFKSTELNRTFDEVVFLNSITNADAIDPEKGLVNPNKTKETVKTGKQPTLNKLEVTIEEIEGGIRIAELFENKQNYAGKKIKIKGEVTKFTQAIMGKNWIHFQDGTEFEGSYDLMITSQENVLVGDIVVFEGTLSLDKDFGAGYFYKVILEKATIIK
ncbi:hypothetical protein [Lutibacter sp.]|uniref:hypothetical protein n=1 Tax=Lutibacter sp. TaxID=1925666 RepID=UPI003566BBD7